MKEVNKGFDGFRALLTRLLDDAITQGELPQSLNSDAVAETLFAGMLGTSVLYGVDKNDSILDQSIDSLIEYMNFLSNRHMLNHVRQSEST
jgi:hypothetical protein